MSTKNLVSLNVPAFASAPTNPSPAAGDIYFNTGDSGFYLYTGSTWTQINRANEFVTLSSTQPASPRNGDAWYDTTSSSYLIYYSGAWNFVGNSNTVTSPSDLTSSWWLGV